MEMEEPSAADRIERRFFLYEQLFSRFETSLPGIYLQPFLLRHCVESYFQDVDRMKGFHKIKRADRHKRAAFSMLWIVRTHPIGVEPGKMLTLRQLLANECFAIHAGLHHLSLKPKCLSPKFASNLLYTLHNRPLTGETLATMMYLVERAANQQTP